MPALLTEKETMKPLIFGPRSIVAWQQHAKTQTRRLVRPQPLEGYGYVVEQSERGLWTAVATIETYWRAEDQLRQPYAVGDICWIREALKRGRFGYIIYAANPLDYLREEDEGLARQWPWKRDKLPAMFMPRWACRYYAKVASVRAERLRDMSHADGVAEGTLVGLTFKNFAPTATWYPGKTRQLYLEWWDSLHRKPGTRSRDNPWVWVYGLEVVDASTD